MTSATLAPSSNRPVGRRQRGFTLVELLVVIGIIALLAGLALGVLTRMRKSAIEAASSSALQTIAQGLEAYKQDFGDYPRTTWKLNYPKLSSKDQPTLPGAHMLCRALVAPGPGTDVQGSDGDGAGGDPKNHQIPGPGFRVRPIVGNLAQGKVYGPYIRADKFIIDDDEDRTTTIDYRKVVLRDPGTDTPILYFPATTVQPRLNTGNGFIAMSSPADEKAVARSLYNPFDNVAALRRSNEGTSNTNALKRFCMMLGDNNANGRIDIDVSDAAGMKVANESALFTGPYILWTAGQDGVFGTDTITRADQVICDDITNIR